MRSPDGKGGDEWSYVDEAFQTAVDLGTAKRETYLGQVSSRNPTLGLEVESLIDAHRAAEGFLETPALEELVKGARVGLYEIVGEVGRGGMGTVYLGVRADAPDGDKFAIKVVNTRLSSGPGSMVARFSREAKILATLNHPNIARFLDGGATEDGRPFLVMEFIQGLPIDLYCDRHRLSITERVELFLAVCSALKHAHQKLIIHRDLKPSNVLVTGNGIPKVLDFGTAKLLHPRPPISGAISTATGRHLMTPGYASPEQVLGDSTSTLSDVYGLGTLLYELLTGHRAHRFRLGSPIEFVKVVCEEAVERPSVAVTSEIGERDSGAGEVSPEVIAERRGTQSAKLRRRLAGDLDKILSKALRKVPGERYGSVEQLSDDLERHLRGLPVLASSSSLFYRGLKFLRRHRAATVATVVFVASTIALGTGLFRQSREIGNQRERAELERKKAEDVSDFLIELFAVRGGSGKAGASARLLLDQGADRIRQSRGILAPIRASQLEAIGRGYRNLGLHEEAAGPLLEALELREASLGSEHLDTALSLQELATLYLEQSRYGEAEPLLMRALSIREGIAGPDALIVAETLDGLSDLYFKTSNRRGESVARRTLQILRMHRRPDHPEVGKALGNLGLALARQGRLEESLPLLESCLRIQERALGPDHRQVADTLFFLGSTQKKMGLFDQAEVALRRSLSRYGDLLGRRHPYVAACHSELGSIRYMRGDYGGAEAEWRLTLEMTAEAYGMEHQWSGNNLHNLALVHLQKGELERAEAGFESAIEILRRVVGPRSHHISFPIHYLGVMARRRGDQEKAGTLLAEALEIRRENLPADHPDIATSLGEIALLHRDRGDFDEAEALLRRALRLRQQSLGPSSLRRAVTEIDLAELLEARGRSREATQLFERAFDTRRRVLGEEHALTLAAAERLVGAQTHAARRKMASASGGFSTMVEER